MRIGQALNDALRRTVVRRFFRQDSRGAASTEFVLIVPFALVLFTGAIEYGNAIAIDRKVTLTAHTVTDLVTQYSAPATADITNALNASASIIAPYSATLINVRVSEVTTDASGHATIFWSQATPNWTKRNTGDPVTLPTNIDTPNVSYIWGEATYLYKPTIGYQVTGQFTLSDSTFMAPRLVTQIPKPN
jgi:Flp pilus assembly protein TadG